MAQNRHMAACVSLVMQRQQGGRFNTIDIDSAAPNISLIARAQPYRLVVLRGVV
jgi:hypothetical protein